MQKTLQFSEPFLKVEYLDNFVDYPITEETIVFNMSDEDILLEEKPLNPRISSIYLSINIRKAKKTICITLNSDFFSGSRFPQADQITNKWTHIYKIFQLSDLENTNLWRSEKERVGNIDFNLWFAAAGTDCGIHNEHTFLELHTQIFGIGRMQKFYKNDKKSIYQDVFMSPGYTHEPFYDEKGLYPWHQYKAETDCIWLATELYS